MLEKAVELRPRDGAIVDSLGWAFYRLGDLPRAVRWLERAVELKPGDPTINDHLGDAYWRTGRKREAGFQWERSLKLNPEPKDREQTERKLKEGLPTP
jgi:Flp pilus assembly protein TadD